MATVTQNQNLQGVVTKGSLTADGSFDSIVRTRGDYVTLDFDINADKFPFYARIDIYGGNTVETANSHYGYIELSQDSRSESFPIRTTLPAVRSVMSGSYGDGLRVDMVARSHI